jgi:hypothetical protein
MTQHGFSAREPDFVDPEGYHQLNHALNLFETEQFMARFPLARNGFGIRQSGPVSSIKIEGGFRFGQAIEATKVASVRNTDPEVVQGATMRVYQCRGFVHLQVGIGAAIGQQYPLA